MEDLDNLDPLGDMENVLDSMTSGTNANSFSKPAMNNYNSNKPKENLWDKKDIKPIELDVANFKKEKKTFMLCLHGREEISLEDRETIIKVVKIMFSKGYTLRSDGDFKNEIIKSISKLENAKIEYYLPFKKFSPEINKPIRFSPSIVAYGITVGKHKTFFNLPSAVRAIIANRIHLLLGADCKKPVDLVIGFNNQGDEVITKDTNFKGIGDLGFIINVANKSNIKVYNLKKEGTISKLSEVLKSN